MKKLEAVFNSIIVKPLSEEETNSGNIIVPDMGKEKHIIGTIISAGPGYYSATGTFVKTTLKEGQIVILPQIGPTKIEFEREEYWGAAENQVLAVVITNKE